MKVKNSITTAIISAAVGLLNPFVPELTPTRLITALQEYDIDSFANDRPKQPYTVKEVCELFRISKPTVYKLKKQGQIAFIKIGSATRIPAEEIERLLSSNQARNQS